MSKVIEGTPVEVKLVDRYHQALAWVRVIEDKQGRMPPLVEFEGRLFAFDNGLEHCGERYHEVVATPIEPHMLVRKA